MPLGEIRAVLRPVLAGYAAERGPAEAFGDWCHRAGVAALQERFVPAAAPDPALVTAGAAP